jgi:hypothetical protein
MRPMSTDPRPDAVSSPGHKRASSVVMFGRSSVLLLVVAAVVAVLLLNTFSHPAGPTFYGVLALPVLGLTAVICWVAVARRSVARRQLPLGLVIAPVMGLLTVWLLHSDLSAWRFKHLDRPAFDAVVAQAPAPVVPLTANDDTGDGYNSDFPGRCPTFIGTLHVAQCATFTAGYLFYQNGTTGSNDGGLAYMPTGKPPYYVGNGSFESPQFVHLAGPWYAFTSSW